MRTGQQTQQPQQSEQSQTAPATICLSTGQSHYLWSDRDAVLFVQSGSISLRESPEWLSDTILRTLSTLDEGQHHQIECSGWICLYATRTAEVLHYASPRPRYLWLTLAGTLLAAPLRRLRNMAQQLRALR